MEHGREGEGGGFAMRYISVGFTEHKEEQDEGAMVTDFYLIKCFRFSY